jgi:hypothetical protein
VSVSLTCAAPSCPDRRITRIATLAGRGAAAYGLCAAQHRLLLRCPGCMRRKFSSVEPGRCVCAHCVRGWKLEGSALVEDAKEATRPAVVSKATAASESPEDAPIPSLEIRETTSYGADGYRGGVHTSSLEIVRPARLGAAPPAKSIAVIALLLFALAMIFGAVVGAVFGASAGVGAMVGALFVELLGSFVLVGGRSGNDRVRIPERTLRVADDRIEAKQGTRWRPIVDGARVSGVVTSDGPDFSSVLVRVEGAEPTLLLDRLRPEEAEELRERLERHLAASRAVR